MDPARERLLNDAISRLNLLGAQYAIVDEDGVKHGSLNIKAEESEPKVRNNFKHHDYAVVIDAMKVGDTYVFPAITEDKKVAGNFRSSLCSRGISIHGPGSMETRVLPSLEVEVKRVA